MQCDICGRSGNHKLPFLCAIDARNKLYEPRIQHARVLLEKDALDQQISALVSDRADADTTQTAGSATKRPKIDVLVSETQQAVDRTQQIIANADELRLKLEQAREELSKRRNALNRRKSDLAAASKITGRRDRQLEEAKKGIQRKKAELNSIHSVAAPSRALLCNEAARLYGLRRSRRSGAEDEYKIGGVAIMDLKALNTASPAQISTTLSHTVHLLKISAQYLGIRLPAEITLPHRDYPLPTIFPLASSHKFTNIPFPGTSQAQGSPSSSRHVEQPNQPRPRPLFVEKPLPLLASEDPAAYSLFLEGVTLLAYDVAWICKSQGVKVGENADFEDICNMGKNFYNLLMGPQHRATSSPFSRDSASDSEKKETLSFMGQVSHSSAKAFLGNADGTDFIRSWKIHSPTKLADQLKSRLMGEIANAEWELLDEDAWAVDDEIGQDGVVVGARKDGMESLARGMQSFMSMRTVLDAAEALGKQGERRSGTNGWTKLKPR